MASQTTFAEGTVVKQISSHSYEAYFYDDWCIGSVPHGGYVTSTILKVVEAHFNSTLASQNQPHTITLHVNFLRRTQAGPAYFQVVDTKLGRQTSVVHVTLSQGPIDDRREEVVGYITNSNMVAEEGLTSTTPYVPYPPPRPVDTALLEQDKDVNWAAQERFPHSRFRRATTKTIFHFPRDGQAKGQSADEWVKLSTGENWTNACLGYICDMWPLPPNLHTITAGGMAKADGSYRPAGYWYPTLLLNLDIKKVLPAEGVKWLFVRVAVKQIRNGRMDLEVVMLDEAGDLVAVSSQVALILSAARNTAERRTGSSSKI